MATALEEFHQEFFQDVQVAADANQQLVEDAFFELYCRELIDAGELDTADRAYLLGQRGLRVDGYGGDPQQAADTLSLIIADFNQSDEVATLTATEMDAIFKRLTNFLERALDLTFRNSIDPSSPAFGLADLIAARWTSISKVRLLLISNRSLSSRVDGRAAGTSNDVPVTYNVWDLQRLCRFVTSGRGREDIEVDLTTDFGGPIPALQAHVDGETYEAYLGVIPGAQLAAIYDRWGARLLEQNVRSFLQLRGNVNKGIRRTLEEEPQMFLAYNNGITATAERVDTALTKAGLQILKLINLQIVNGGQTTASIHAAARQKVDLSKVFVQMKLSIVEPSLVEKVVPKISEFANTQNLVNAADFSANHPFHIRMEEFSRRIFAPSPDGTFRESKWFYERARGQYQDARANLTETQRKAFDLEYPKAQLFSKTDLAKFLNLWRGHPDIVSRGAQKNFANFAEAIGKEWDAQPLSFNEDFYRHAIAKAIVFRETERLVTQQAWYQGGYRANVVAYAIAKVAKDVDEMGLSIDFNQIWRSQRISPAFSAALEKVAKVANDGIVDTEKNVTEWAKQQACWNRVGALKVDWPKGFTKELITREALQQQQKVARRDQKVLVGIEAQTVVVNAGSALWREVKEWGLAKGLVTTTEAEILEVAAKFQSTGRAPSDKQCERIIQTLKRLHGEGCQIGVELL